MFIMQMRFPEGVDIFRTHSIDLGCCPANCLFASQFGIFLESRIHLQYLIVNYLTPIVHYQFIQRKGFFHGAEYGSELLFALA